MKQIHPSVVQKINEIVSRGITKAHEVQLLLEEFVRTEFPDIETRPNKGDRAWYPSEQDVRNHVYMSALKQKFSEIDQVNLEECIKKWKEEDPDRKFYFRMFTGLL